MLGSPKDKSDMLDKTGTVYHYTCHECPSHYIGETERPLGKRVSERKRESSPVGSHSKITKHSFDPEHFKILDTDPRWHQRGIKNANLIREALLQHWCWLLLVDVWRVESHDRNIDREVYSDHMTRSVSCKPSGVGCVPEPYSSQVSIFRPQDFEKEYTNHLGTQNAGLYRPPGYYSMSQWTLCFEKSLIFSKVCQTSEYNFKAFSSMRSCL